MSAKLKAFITDLYEEIGAEFENVDVDVSEGPEGPKTPGYEFVVGVIESTKEAILSLDIDDSHDLSHWWSSRGHEAIEGFSDYADETAALIWVQIRGWEKREEPSVTTSDVTRLINCHLYEIAYGIAEAVYEETLSEIEAWEERNLDGEEDDE